MSLRTNHERSWACCRSPVHDASPHPKTCAISLTPAIVSCLPAHPISRLARRSHPPPSTLRVAKTPRQRTATSPVSESSMPTGTQQPTDRPAPPHACMAARQPARPPHSIRYQVHPPGPPNKMGHMLLTPRQVVALPGGGRRRYWPSSGVVSRTSADLQTVPNFQGSMSRQTIGTYSLL